MLKDKSSCCSHHIPLFLPLTHSHISAVNNMAPSYWDSQKKWYCRIIPTPRGLRQSIIQHCQPVARFVYVMIYWIQLLFFFFPFFFFSSHWQIYWVLDRWPDTVLCDSRLTYKSEMWVWKLVYLRLCLWSWAELSCNFINRRSNITRA